MKNEKPYRNPLLSLNSMARSLHISPKYLSQIINERFTQNFSDFINSYRVQETIDLINQGDQSRTILDISHEAGFNAKSTFNLVFKKHTGISPREYMKKIAGSSSGKRLSFIR
jgi:AraC-like DNA-binding protein